MRAFSRRLPTARCRRGIASGRTNLRKNSACRASRFPMRYIYCTARGWSPRAAAAALKSRGAIDALAARLAAGRVKSDATGRARLEAALRAGRAIDKKAPLARLIALDVDFHSAIYRLAGNPAIEEMIAPQWPHMRRSMATVLVELDYRESAWSEHEAIAARILAGQARAAEAAALAHAMSAGRMTEERPKGSE